MGIDPEVYVLDADPATCVSYYTDKHVHFSALVYGRILSTAHHFHGQNTRVILTPMELENIYTPFAIESPVVQWVIQNEFHYTFMYQLLCAVLDEYVRRFGKLHATEEMRRILRTNPCNQHTTFFVHEDNYSFVNTGTQTRQTVCQTITSFPVAPFECVPTKYWCESPRMSKHFHIQNRFYTGADSHWGVGADSCGMNVYDQRWHQPCQMIETLRRIISDDWENVIRSSRLWYRSTKQHVAQWKTGEPRWWSNVAYIDDGLRPSFDVRQGDTFQLGPSEPLPLSRRVPEAIVASMHPQRFDVYLDIDDVRKMRGRVW